VALAACPALASAHEFEIHAIAPSDDWCAELHEVARAADVIELEQGRYAGGCDLTLGGLPSHNESLLVMGTGLERTIIEADADGLSLRISGEPTRLYRLELEGRLEVVANNATVDSCSVSCVEVDPTLDRFAFLYGEASRLDVFTADTVIRGSQLGEADVGSATGLVADNVVFGDLWSSVDADRNLVLGDLTTEAEARANVVVGTTTATGTLIHNTLLGEVSAPTGAANNLTVTAALDPAQGNLQCSDCLVDVELLDVQPTGAALEAPLVSADGVEEDFCGLAPSVVGAVGELGEPWSAHERDRFGCEPGMAWAPLPPADTCPPPEDTGTGSTTDPSTTELPDTTADPEPTTPVVTDTGGASSGAGPRPPRRGRSQVPRGCAVVGLGGAGGGWLVGLVLMRRRR